MKELYSAMASAFGEMEGATKGKVNPAFKSKYADLGSVVDAIKPALVKFGLFFTQITHDMEDGVCVETIVMHKSGEQMSFGKLSVPATKKDAQGYGSALTYCRRYSLMAAFGVAPEDDDGQSAVAAQRAGAANDTPSKPKQQPLKGKHKTREALRKAAGEIATVIAEAVDGGDVSFLNAALENYADDIRQIREEGNPEWWSNPDWGLAHKIEDAMVALNTPRQTVLDAG